jgi:hypothetical protein
MEKMKLLGSQPVSRVGPARWHYGPSEYMI